MRSAIACLALAVSPVVCAQSPTETPANTPIKIATIDTRVANDEFNRNVQVMQARRAEVVRLQEAVQAAATNAEKATLETELQTAMERLNTDNQSMAKAYGYSLLRNYIRSIENSEVYLQLTDEEFAKQTPSADGTQPQRLVKVCELGDAAGNLRFEEAVAKLQAMRDQLVQFNNQWTAATSAEEKAYLKGKVDLLTQQLVDANNIAARTFGFSMTRNYQRAINKSSLYLLVTPEEAAKMKAADSGNSSTGG